MIIHIGRHSFLIQWGYFCVLPLTRHCSLWQWFIYNLSQWLGNSHCSILHHTQRYIVKTTSLACFETLKCLNNNRLIYQFKFKICYWSINFLINASFFKRNSTTKNPLTAYSGWSENIIETISNFLSITGFTTKHTVNIDIFGNPRALVPGNDLLHCSPEGFGVIFVVVNKLLVECLFCPLYWVRHTILHRFIRKPVFIMGWFSHLYNLVVTLTNVILYLASHPWTIIYTTYSLLDKRGVTISHLKDCGLTIEPEFVNTNDILICCPRGIHTINSINTSKVFTKLCRVVFCIIPENLCFWGSFHPV